MKHERDFTGADTGYEEPSPAELQAEVWADCLSMCDDVADMANAMGVSVSTVRRGLRGETVSAETADRFRRLHHSLLAREYEASIEWMGY